MHPKPVQGILRKMVTHLASPIQYELVVGEKNVGLNPYLGRSLSLQFTGKIYCIQCGRKTNKSFQQGYCFPCMRRLAECNFCITRPEKCRYEEGNCRADDWAHAQCGQSHWVYLANTSGLKVGITREHQILKRWIDQGARQGLILFRVANRYQAGMIEKVFKQWVADRTHFRQMLTQEAVLLDLLKARENLLSQAADSLAQMKTNFCHEDIQLVLDAKPLELDYPIVKYPIKVVNLIFDKTARVEGELQGIKGQYLIFSTGVLNIRKFSGYEVEVAAISGISWH